MSKNDRFRRAVRGVWEQSDAACRRWPEERRRAVQPAVDALLAWLADAESEGALIARYWGTGDPPGAVLRAHLPEGFDPEDALTLEETCFHRRAAELDAGGGDA